MSRIGKKPVVLPSGVSATIASDSIAVKGPKGEVSVVLPHGVCVEEKDGHLILENKGGKDLEALYGTTRANLHNAVVGVSEGFTVELIITGIGYRCALRGEDLVLNVGYSHEVVVKPLPGVKIAATDETHVTVTGIDKQKVGQTAALIHDVKRPEPYGGKGIAYKGEKIIRKEGKRTAGGKK